MRILVALAAAAALGLAACSQAETDQAVDDAQGAAAELGEAAENAGEALGEAASETGEAIEGAVNDATATEEPAAPAH